MRRGEPRSDVVLRLLDGSSAQLERVLEGGASVPPFAVGTRGGWVVRGPHVAKAHVLFAFNGDRLFACTPRGEQASLDGAALDASWREVALPAEVRFGAARMSLSRRAGPDEATERPDGAGGRGEDAATSLDEGRQASALRAMRRAPDDEVTCIQATTAERAAHPADEELTCIQEVEVPAEARGPTNEEPTTPPSPPLPAPRPSLPQRTVRIVRRQERPAALRTAASPPPLPSREPVRAPAPAARGADAGGDLAEPSASCELPCTIPGASLASTHHPAAPAHRSASTVALALPIQGSPHLASRDAQAWHPALPSGAPSARDTPSPWALDAPPALTAAPTRDAARPAASASPVQAALGALRRSWQETSLPRRAIALLLVPTLLAAGSLGRSEPSAVASTAAGTTPPPSPTAAPAPPVRAASSPVAKPLVATPSVGAPSVAAPIAQAASALRDTRSPERRALDTVAAGLDASAAEQYDSLAAAHPENPAFREAARILHARASTSAAP
jgi:hypothetical protein